MNCGDRALMLRADAGGVQRPSVLLMFFCAGLAAGCKPDPAPPPQQFVLAYTRTAGGASAVLETRVSVNGTAWSLPRLVADSVGTARVPVTVHAGATGSVIPGAGIATDGRVYQIAFFDPASVLMTRFSSDGLVWDGGSAHGSPVPVDIQSRPTLAVGNGRWIAAIRLRPGNLIIQPLNSNASSITLLDGATPGAPLRSDYAPALAFGNDRYLLAYIERGTNFVRVLSSTNGVNWPTGPGATLSFPAGVTPPPTMPGGMPPLLQGQGAPYLTFASDSFHLAVTREIHRTPSLFDGQAITHRSADGTTWTFVAAIEPTTALPVGLALAAADSSQVMVEPQNALVPSVWVNRMELKPSPLVPSVVLGTPISLVHGPRRIDIRNAHIVFKRFKRVPDPGNSAGNQTEDVTLSATHVDAAGSVVRTLAPWTVSNAALRQTHMWNEGRGNTDLPVLNTLLQPGDSVMISVSGRNGTVRRGFSFADLVLSGLICRAADSQLEIQETGRSFWYQLFVSCNLTPR